MTVTEIEDRMREQGDPDPDCRPLLSWEEPVALGRAGYCSVTTCAYQGPGGTVIKHRWTNRPLGQLMTRCPTHETAYEAGGIHEARRCAEGIE